MCSVVEDLDGATLERIEAAYRKRLSELRRVATAITGDREAALDAVQEAFATAVRQRGTFQGRGNLDGWIWRIVVNSARDHATAERSLHWERNSSEPSAVGASPLSNTEIPDVRSLLAAVPERQRLVVFLRYYADLDYGTIGEVLAISPGTVGATLNQALNNLRRLLKEVHA